MDDINKFIGVDYGELAGRGSRLVASILDMIIIFLPYFLVTPFVSTASADVISAVGGLSILAVIIVQIVLLSVKGQTIGKKAVRIRVVRVDTGKNGGFITNVLLRGLVNGIISLIPIYAIIDCLFIFSDDRRCLHDKIARTKVVKA